MPDTPFQTGSVGSFDPVTGERRTTTFNYQPAPPPSPMDILGKIAGEAYSTLPLDEAEKATAAAIQFQGMRGYQQALKNGDTADKALATWGPLMFYQKPQAIAPMLRATTPAVMTPYQAWQIDQAKAPKLMNVGSNLLKVTPEGNVETLFSGTKPTTISPQAAFQLSSDPMKMAMIQSTYGPEVASNIVSIGRSAIQAPTIPGPSKTAAGMPANERIRVKAPSGKVGSIPASQKDEALKAGYIIVQ